MGNGAKVYDTLAAGFAACEKESEADIKFYLYSAFSDGVETFDVYASQKKWDICSSQSEQSSTINKASISVVKEIT